MSDLVFQTCCPVCGSANILCMTGMNLDMCLKCHRVWERLPTGEAYLRDGEMLAFKKPCDNCAFRQGSTERNDPELWAELQFKLDNGGDFFCHKGVPLTHSVEELKALLDAGDYDQKNAFDFPMVEKTVDVAGTCHPYQAYDRDKMRLCRGFLAAIWGPKFTKFDKENLSAKAESHQTSR